MFLGNRNLKIKKKWRYGSGQIFFTDFFNFEMIFFKLCFKKNERVSMKPVEIKNKKNVCEPSNVPYDYRIKYCQTRRQVL